MRAVVSQDAFIERFLDVEAALARAEAAAGIIPESAAETISERASTEHLDPDAVEANMDVMGLLSMAVITAWKDSLGPDGEYVHYGATSQDIYDTARVLQLRDAVDLIWNDLQAIIDELVELAEEHRETPMMGRTHYVHAIPITFGLKVAVWADEFDRHRDRLSELEDRLFVLQFCGATGTLASLGEAGFEVQDRLGDELGLAVPPAPWAAARDRFAEVGTVLGLIASTAGKVANQVLLLNRPEFDEVSHPVPDGAIGSSTMPHKRNPKDSEVVVGLAKLVRSNAQAMLELMETVDERSASTLYMEFGVLPELLCYTSRILANTQSMLAGLEVSPDAMAQNMEIVGDLVASERVMMALADTIGRQTAHDIVYSHAMAAARGGESFTDRLIADSRVTDHLAEDEVRRLTDPTGYVGNSARIVDNVLAQIS